MTIGKALFPDRMPASFIVECENCWPVGCLKPESCERNEQCMYEPCPFEGRKLTKILDLLAEKRKRRVRK
jgi:hypothetical protein